MIFGDVNFLKSILEVFITAPKSAYERPRFSRKSEYRTSRLHTVQVSLKFGLV